MKLERGKVMEKEYIGSAIPTSFDVCEHAVDGFYVGSMCELTEEEVLTETAQEDEM